MGGFIYLLIACKIIRSLFDLPPPFSPVPLPFFPPVRRWQTQEFNPILPSSVSFYLQGKLHWGQSSGNSLSNVDEV